MARGAGAGRSAAWGGPLGLLEGNVVGFGAFPAYGGFMYPAGRSTDAVATHAVATVSVVGTPARAAAPTYGLPSPTAGRSPP